jgi:predicted DsbA family dithiol-disulfide isomerase
VSQAIKVDIWSDIACPWCFIGKRRFEEGVRRFTEADALGRQVSVEYHSFELSPDTPLDFAGSEADFLVGHKGIPLEQAEQMLRQVVDIAESVGLTFAYDRVRHTKTLKAHQVLHLAKARGRQLEVAERLFQAYFSQGRHVGRDEDLADLAAEAGLDRTEVLSALAAGAYADEVQADIDQARAYGISGVPFFVIDSRYGVSGAQDPEVFVRALQAAAEASAEPAEAAS